MAGSFLEDLFSFFSLRKVYAIDPVRFTATTTNQKHTFATPIHRLTITTDSDVVFALKEYCDVNEDIRLQAGQSLNFDDIEINAVSVITSSGTANVDVIGFHRIK